MPSEESEFDESITSVPAYYANSFIVSVNQDRIRITFGENLEGKTYYRTAVSMPISDGESLSDDIIVLLKKFRERALKNQQ